MHIPEGFLTGTTTAVGAAVAVAGLAVAIRKADLHADNGRLPLAGLAGAFFLVGDSPFLPIGVGTQGHLLGGTLAVALLGPWLGLITIAVVTVVQALVQGDGGITVLGLNIVNAGIVPAFIGWPLLRGVQAVIRRWQGRSTPGGLAVACAVAAYVNVVLASLLFVTEFHLGHKGSVQIGPVIGGTVGTYALIGIAEALLTAGIVKALLARRPDLVLIAPPELRRTLRPPLRRRPAPGPRVPPPPGTEPQRAARTSPPPPPGTEPQRAVGTSPPPPPGTEPQRAAGAAGPAAGDDAGTSGPDGTTTGRSATVTAGPPPPPGCEPQGPSVTDGDPPHGGEAGRPVGDPPQDARESGAA